MPLARVYCEPRPQAGSVEEWGTCLSGNPFSQLVFWGESITGAVHSYCHLLSKPRTQRIKDKSSHE